MLETKKKVWNALGLIKNISVGLSGLLAYLFEAKIDEAPSALKGFAPAIKVIQVNTWWVIIALIVFSAVLGLIRNFYFKNFLLADAVAAVLDNARSIYIKSPYEFSDQVHHHRVTVFKHKTFCFWPRPMRHPFWPWGKRSPFSGWLVPFARSGHTTQKIKSTFLAPDDAEEAEGIAGKAWGQNGPIYLVSLPNVSQNQTEHCIAEYAKRTFVPESYIKAHLNNKKPMSRAYLGFKISIEDAPWGVVVVDSVRPDGIVDPRNLQAQTVQLELVMASLLKMGAS